MLAEDSKAARDGRLKAGAGCASSPCARRTAISASAVSRSRSLRGYFRILVAISRNTKADVMQITWRDPPLYSGPTPSSH